MRKVIEPTIDRCGKPECCDHCGSQSGPHARFLHPTHVELVLCRACLAGALDCCTTEAGGRGGRRVRAESVT